MIAILGAGGAISNALCKLLAASATPFRLVSRKAAHDSAANQVLSADLSILDQTVEAVRGTSVVFLTAGLQYDHKVWAEFWPRIMANTIEACKRTGARLVFFDNVYMYGRVNGPMTETTPFNPCSRKGEVRARLAASLAGEWQAGSLTGMIARCADFYGPAAAHGIPNVLLFDPYSKGQSAMCLVRDDMPHSYTYTPDAARALVTLSTSEAAWNQTWHLPTAPDPLTGKQFILAAAEAMNTRPKYRILTPFLVRIGGIFNPMVREIHEMLYQNDSPYIFDSQKFAHAFGTTATPYGQGIRETAQSYSSPSAG